ncbi:flagellar export chaperone FlgN [Rugamonas sp. CCM 8940]|uniref:flagellar export chaperone FlgN n=1 Tax=Rugamonas sp. CCM 8940 TaxID=2765359 RepID=UPI0018F4CAE5|nr:flagellar export chaperone FlgN [Rugamonas sp. CCM 8940]MBJ7310696.1 flagellar export chaperone FlgN [Rugamonas sp. CCM 8940]
MNQMTRQQAMHGLLQGLAEDGRDYPLLHELLEQQFRAALRHQSAPLAEVAESISALVDQLDARRRLRLQLAQRLLGPQPAMAQVFALLKSGARDKAEADWHALEQQVLECKRVSKRNGELLLNQHTIMQRVLHGEEHLYAPA